MIKSLAGNVDVVGLSRCPGLGSLLGFLYFLQIEASVVCEYVLLTSTGGRPLFAPLGAFLSVVSLCRWDGGDV